MWEWMWGRKKRHETQIKSFQNFTPTSHSRYSETLYVFKMINGMKSFFLLAYVLVHTCVHFYWWTCKIPSLPCVLSEALELRCPLPPRSLARWSVVRFEAFHSANDTVMIKSLTQSSEIWKAMVMHVTAGPLKAHQRFFQLKLFNQKS